MTLLSYEGTKIEEDMRRQHQRMDRTEVLRFHECRGRYGKVKGIVQRHLWCHDSRQG